LRRHSSDKFCFFRSVIRPLEKEIKRAINEEIKRQSQKLTADEIAESLAAQAREEEQLAAGRAKLEGSAQTQKSARQLRKEARQNQQADEEKVMRRKGLLV